MKKKTTAKKAPQKSTELNEQQLRFTDEYLVDLNGKQAAIRAGYSEKTAESQASRLLRNVKVQEILAEKIAKRSEAVGLDAQWVLERLKEIVERSLQIKPVMEKVDGEWVETGEFKYDSSGANKALELIGRHLKMFTDRVEVDATEDLIQRLVRGRKRACGSN